MIQVFPHATSHGTDHVACLEDPVYGEVLVLLEEGSGVLGADPGGRVERVALGFHEVVQSRPLQLLNPG